MPDLVARARAYAMAAGPRLRTGGGPPWPHEHLLRDAASVVASIEADAELVAAAWLYDVVEDTPVTFGDIEREFGARVARVVADAAGPAWPRAVPRGRRRRRDVDLAGLTTDAVTVGLAVVIATGRLVKRRMPDRWPGFQRDIAHTVTSLGRSVPEALVRQAVKLAGAMEQIADAPRASASATIVPPVLGLEQHRLERLFTEAFTAAEIARPLRSFDDRTPAAEAARSATAVGADAVGVREAGQVTGYALVADLTAGSCANARRIFAPDQIVDSATPLSTVIDVLARFDHCFVAALGTVAGAISRQDMQQPPVRMWLFGIITLAEMEIVRRIQTVRPGGGWMSLVPPDRLARARALQEERARRGQASDLVDCLQLSDKAHVLMEDAGERSAFGFDSRASARRVIQDLESLRNNLAHAQDIVTHDWAQIVRLARRFE